MDTNHPDDRYTSLRERTAAKQTRRRYTIAQKREMVEETLEDGQSVSMVEQKWHLLYHSAEEECLLHGH